MLNACYKNFLRTGNPNGAGLPEWKSWASLGGTTQLLAGADACSEIIAMMEEDSTIPRERKMAMIRAALSGRRFSSALDEYYQNPSLWR